MQPYAELCLFMGLGSTGDRSFLTLNEKPPAFSTEDIYSFGGYIMHAIRAGRAASPEDIGAFMRDTYKVCIDRKSPDKEAACIERCLAVLREFDFVRSGGGPAPTWPITASPRLTLPTAEGNALEPPPADYTPPHARAWTDAAAAAVALPTCAKK